MKCELYDTSNNLQVAARIFLARYWWRCPILTLILSLNSGLCKRHVPNLSQPSAQRHHNPLLEINDFSVFRNHLSEENGVPAKSQLFCCENTNFERSNFRAAVQLDSSSIVRFLAEYGLVNTCSSR